MDMTIGSLAKRAKVNLATLRYYEHFGLLKPVGRASSGYRLYNEGSLLRLKFIRYAQDQGFSLKEIGTLLKLDPRSSFACRKAKRMAEIKVLEVDRKIDDLEKIVDNLTRLLRECGRRHGRAGCPILSRFYQGSGYEEA
ncbi:MAG TPA: heavy metal-responsive transcriptional regulator [bacterium]|nr:heavy metal-responsive transcriptional regulator [bacterium]